MSAAERCPSFEALSRAFSAPQPSALGAHVHGCMRCLRVWRELEAMRTAAHALPSTAMDPDHVARIEDELLLRARADHAWRTRAARRRRAVGLAAAGVAAAAAVVAALAPEPRPERAPVVAASAAGPASAAVEPMGEAQFERVVREGARGAREELVRVRSGALRLTVPAVGPTDAMRVVAGDAELDVRAGSVEVEVQATRLVRVRVVSGRVALRGPDGLERVLGAGERWSAAPVRAEGAGSAPERRGDGAGGAGSTVDAVSAGARGAGAVAGAGGGVGAGGLAGAESAGDAGSAAGAGRGRGGLDLRGAGAPRGGSSSGGDAADARTTGVGPPPAGPAAIAGGAGAAATTSGAGAPRVGSPARSASAARASAARGAASVVDATAGTAAGGAGASTAAAASGPPAPVGATAAPRAVAASNTPGLEPGVLEAAAAERAFAEGWELLDGGDASLAAERFAAVRDGELAEDAAYWRAVALGRARRDREAEAALRAFLEAFPGSPRAGEAQVMWGWQRLERGDAAGARAAFESALRNSDGAVREGARAGLAAAAQRGR